ncbi:MAG: efflux RND transporter periplasmic adaptor subunit [Deltaproteobacteria bacterium]
MRKILLPILLLLILAAGGAVWWFHFRPNDHSNSRIFISGNIEATEVDLAFRIGGQIKTFPAEEGDSVRAGQVIAELDTDTLLALKGAAEAEIQASQATLDELEVGTRAEQIEMARAVVRSAASRLKNAKAEYERYVPLFKQGAVSASAFDAKETALKVATAEFNNASEHLKELEVGPREEKIRAARARLERAKWELKKIELDLKHSEVTSPIQGRLLVKSNEAGEVVLPGATVATVAETGKVWLKGYVGEKDLGKVKLGEKVEVTTDSYPGKIYHGRVTYISSRAEFTPKNVQTLEERVKQVYRVKVTIPNPSEELKIGMPAEGYILAGNDHSGTSAVSRRAPALDAARIVHRGSTTRE